MVRPAGSQLAPRSTSKRTFQPAMSMFPTLCDVCYDQEPVGECHQPFRLSRTATPSVSFASALPNPRLHNGGAAGRHSAAGAASLLVPGTSSPARSKTTIGHYSDPPEKVNTSSSFLTVPVDFGRSKTDIRFASNRFFNEHDEDEEKLVWADGLKRWVLADPENLPYFSFCNTANMTERISPRVLRPRRVRRKCVPVKSKTKPPPTFVQTNLRKSQSKSAQQVHFADSVSVVDDLSSETADSYLEGLLNQKESDSFDLGSDFLSGADRLNDSALQVTDVVEPNSPERKVYSNAPLTPEVDPNALRPTQDSASKAPPFVEKVVTPDFTTNSIPSALVNPEMAVEDGNANVSANMSLAVDGDVNALVEEDLKVSLASTSHPTASAQIEKKADDSKLTGRNRRCENSKDQKKSPRKIAKKKKETDKEKKANGTKEEPAPIAEVTREIASVRLEESPRLSLVVDPESKVQLRSRGPPNRENCRPRLVPRKKINVFASAPKPPQPRKSVGWLFEEEKEKEEDKEEPLAESEEEPKLYSIPPLPTPPLPPPSPKAPSPELLVHDTELPLLHQKRKPRPRWGPRRRDQSYMNQLRDDERRERARQIVAKLASKVKERTRAESCGVKDAPRFEQYGFLSKYCILNRTSVEMYRTTFDAVDDDQKGWLTYEETLIGLRGVNPRLKDAEERYLYRVLEMCGYNVKRGADFKLFAVMAAMSQKITSLDSWMRNIIGRMDFKMLEMKMFMCKHLWECNVDHDTNCIAIEQLCVELRAGGVTEAHIDEVRQRLGWMRSLDLMDFLTYIPLFILLHTSIVDNPLDMSRTK